jgi:hypothetical protein
MARTPPDPEKKLAHLSSDEMRSGIDRIKRLLERVK